MKKCSSCQEMKKEDEFYKNSSRKDGISTYCKKCNTLWVRKRYLKNKEYYNGKNKENRLRNKKFIYNFLLNNPCIDCGEDDPIVLEFDHQRDKINCISVLSSKMYSIATLKKEIEKCEIRCANCHRRKTAKQMNYNKFIED